MNSSPIAGRARRRTSRSPEGDLPEQAPASTRSPRPSRPGGFCLGEPSGTPFGEALQRQRIETVLDLEHAGRERIRRVVGQHRDAGLFDDRTRIEIGHDGLEITL